MKKLISAILAALVSVLVSAQDVTVTKVDTVIREQGVLVAVDSADHNFTYSVKCVNVGGNKTFIQTIHSKDKLMLKPYQLPDSPLLAIHGQPMTDISLQHFYEVWDKEQPRDVPATITPDFQTISNSVSGRGHQWLFNQFATHSSLVVSLHRSGTAQEEPVSFDIRGIAPELAKHDECK